MTSDLPRHDTSRRKARPRQVLKWSLGSGVAMVVVGACALFLRRVHVLMSDIGEVQVDILHDLMAAGRLVMEQGESGCCPPSVDHILDSLGRDPWGHDYRYERSPNVDYSCRLFTLGADGAPGGVGEDEDIILWIDMAHGRRVSYRLDRPPMGMVW